MRLVVEDLTDVVEDFFEVVVEVFLLDVEDFFVLEDVELASFTVLEDCLVELADPTELE